jgi:hypothetical protein
VFVSMAASCALLAAVAGTARAEHDGSAPARSGGPVDVDVHLGRDGFRVGGRVLGPGGAYGAWLKGTLRGKGITLDGLVEHPGNAKGFSLDAELPGLKLRTWEAPTTRI